MENTRSTSLLDYASHQDPMFHIDNLGSNGIVYYESTINPIHNAKGELEGIYMAGRNVTEMVESFHHQQEGFKKLRQATRSIKTYIDNVNYALQVSDVRLVNYYPSTHTMEISVNINETQLRFSQLRCIRLGAPRFRRAISSALNRMDHRTEIPLQTVIETEIPDKQRRHVWLQFSMVPMKDEEGRVERYFGMCRNMTQMVETELQLAIETQKAQETELLKQAFLTNMSYEIRTPLNAIMGFAQLMSNDLSDEERSLYNGYIQESNNQLLSTLDDIIDVSNMEVGTFNFQFEEMDIDELCNEYIEHNRDMVPQGVELVYEPSENNMTLYSDRRRIGQVLQNLLSNACKNTTSGRITINTSRGEDCIQFVVTDTGTGIPQGKADVIFEHFEKLDHYSPGLGLGLYVGRLRHLGIGHHSRGIGVHEHDLVALLPQRLHGLDAGVVELASLPDHNRTRTDDQNLLQICTLHIRNIRSISHANATMWQNQLLALHIV